MDEDDLDNYDADFTGQSKGKIKGQSSKYQKKITGNDETSGQASGTAGQSTGNPASSAPSGNETSQGAQASSGPSLNTGASAGTTSTTGTQTSSPSSQGTVTGGAPQQGRIAPSTATHGAGNQNAAPSVGGHEGHAPHGLTPEVKYLDKLYDEILKTTNSNNGIHVPDFHSKYNDFRKKYEFTMNEQEYQIVKNLFDAFFKEGNSNGNGAIAFFKKLLNDNGLQKQFDNFQHGLYGFAKRHNYLRADKNDNEKLYKDLLNNIINLLNTIEMK
ncbi:hypothetical protein AK88_04057 [Plasmodium fragile]|nr:uncharacterized protein AK88_04057 [Plasmodium fragile]KJP86338.1 hypothetical protein AK88_04057 [Plasmodium fragile]